MRMSGTGNAYGGSKLKESAEPWSLQGEEYCLQKDSNFGCQWNEVTLNDEDPSYMLDDETTFVKACGDLAYHAPHSGGGDMNKEPIECRETSSQVKRRRMLQFETQVADFSLCSNEMSSTFLRSNERGDSVEEVLPEASDWIFGFSEDVTASGCDDLDQSFDGWIAQCFNDAEMNVCPDDILKNNSGASNVQIDISEFGNSQPAYGATLVQQHAIRTLGNIVFKGRKSFIQTPTKLGSSVAYPFAFIKPCGVHGDVTLRDINQRIHTPSKSKQNIEEDPTAYPTSTFSGKPVVGRTKICTEGGKGSITIMRTKG